MVVFIDGQPKTAEYRRFRIKTVVGANDFASMAEILGRRFKRWETNQGDAGQAEFVEGSEARVRGRRGRRRAASRSKSASLTRDRRTARTAARRSS